ncbi:hypothetical protein PENFLA_c004G10140 [Penicillium flavigenum]|uniref:DUF6536 domain-containing protein n=1 Tax=Penicillium flavigenum TaxID=254877 RepID=A0A1V6TTM4_9EURO|nr:hypothetical protein PENFLA_c004G10140 [Penicillium flavigenum]
MLYTISHHRQDDTKGILYQGDCDKVQHLDIGFHLLINMLCTTLLSASNFGMQCLAAPTRRNIDRAHQKGKWLDIGVPSIRNLFRVSEGRSLLWICLASSSLPFHLMYNSTIFSTTSVTAYHIFLGHGDLDKISSPDLEVPLQDTDKWSSFNGLLSSAKSGSLQHLDLKECVEDYAQTFQTTYGNLLLVTEQVLTNTSYVYLTMQGVFNPQRYLETRRPRADPYRWLCPNDLGYDCEVYLPSIQSQIKKDNWTVAGHISSGGGWKVDYCLAEKVRDIVLYVVWYERSSHPDHRDAIASFLRRPDPYTKGGCLLLNREVESMLWYLPTSIKKYPLHKPRKYVGKRRRWGSAVSTRRWVFSISFWFIAILACIILLVYGISQITTGSPVWRATLGEANASTLIKGGHWPGTLIPIVIIANIPQLIFSFLYFAFNSLLTAMNIAAEWSGFAVNRKGLRVSGSPSLSQRSNYFLSLPYRYAIPLMGVSSLLHWLISRSLFMVGIDAYGPSMERQPDNDVLTCGYSPVAIVSSTVVGSVMFFCLVGLSFRLFESGMPVVGSCSFTIAAACHPAFDPNRQGDGEVDVGMEWENKDYDMALLPVQWGSVPVVGPVGHCSFTSGDVEEPRGPHGDQKYL